MRTLVGKKAPHFSSTAVVNGCDIIYDFSLDQFLHKKYVILFFYPKDFTFVCPTEIIAFQEYLHEFEKRNTAVIGCSTDSEFSHLAWLNAPRECGGIKGVSFPLVSDINKTISEDYGVLAGEYKESEQGNIEVVGELVAYRGLFLIDKSGIIQHCVINNMSIGRGIDEVIRVIDALQHFEKCGNVCPANWKFGQKSLQPTQAGLRDFFDKSCH